MLISLSLSRWVLEFSVSSRLDSDHPLLNATLLLPRPVHLNAKPHLQDKFLNLKHKRLHWTEGKQQVNLADFFGSSEGETLKNQSWDPQVPQLL